MKIKGAIFDMDGTLVDSLIFWDYLWQEIGSKYMGNADFKPIDEVNKKVRTMVYADAMAYFKDFYRIPGETEEFIRFASSGIMEFYRNVAKVKSGAIELLEYLKKQQVKLCLASATTMKEVKFTLQYHGLSAYFDTVLSCAEIGVGKDRPDIYLEAVRRMGLEKNEVCVFEDSYVALETAKNVGFQTVGIYDKYNLEQERLKRASDIYLDETQTLDALIAVINQ